MLPTVEFPNWPTKLEKEKLEEYGRKFGIQVCDDGGAYTSVDEDAPQIIIRPIKNEEAKKKEQQNCFCKDVKADLQRLHEKKSSLQSKMSFCPSAECPLNFVNVTPATSGFDLIVSFFASTHQHDVVFTPEQLSEVYNEILFMVKKYQDAKTTSQKAMAAAGTHGGQEIKSINLNYSRDSVERENGIQFNDNINNTAPIFNNEETHHTGQYDYKNVTMVSPNQSTDRMTCVQQPQSYETLSVPSVPPSVAASFSSTSSLPNSSPFLNISFKDIYMRRGFIGLNKIESLDKLARCVSKPLGCCYDEGCQIWAIADSANDRVVLYPKGITIESPKFKNPATVCVVDQGKTLGILSDCCLATYSYDDETVAIIAESNRLQCRGLVRTPCGHLATIQRNGSSRDIVLYDISEIGYGRQHCVVNISSDGAANPSFCAMNGNRLVVTDLGRQVLILVVFSPDEKSAHVRQTPALLWKDKHSEPNGHFDFVSGVQMDRNGWIIVADAGGHTLQLFDEELNFITRVGTNFALPYMSTICINNAGKVVIVGRRDNDITLSELVSLDSLPPLQKQSSGGMRGGGRGRGSGTTRGGGFSSRGGGHNTSFGSSNYGQSNGGSRFA